MANPETETETETAVEQSLTRDSVRAAIFSGKHQLKKKVIDFFGTQIELRQSTLGSVLVSRDEGDTKAAVVRQLLENAYVPKTDIRVFEDSDADTLLNLPFGVDFIRITEALEELTGVNFREAAARAKTESN